MNKKEPSIEELQKELEDAKDLIRRGIKIIKRLNPNSGIDSPSGMWRSLAEDWLNEEE